MLRFALKLPGLVAVAVLSISASAAHADFLREAVGSWAIGGSANCQVPSKAYVLTTYEGNITWRNGNGDVDIETVIAGNDGEFQTVTINSIHRAGGGYARGTAWTYTNTGPGSMLVSVGTARAFVLARCF